MTYTRTRLPNRRKAETRCLDWGGHRFDVTVGFYEDGRAGEVFVHGPREGSEVQALLEDACIMASNLRQYGLAFSELADRLRPDPDAAGGSPVHAIMDMAAAIEAEASARASGKVVDLAAPDDGCG